MINSRYSNIIGSAGQGAAIGSAFGAPGAVIGGIAGGLAGGLFGDDAEDLADTLADAQIKEIDRAEAENRRRTLLEMSRDVGRSRAAIGASNLQFSGSPQRYTGQIAREYRHQLAWDRQRANVEKQMARLGGQMAVDQIRSSALQGAIGGVGSLIGAFAFPQTSGTLSAINVDRGAHAMAAPRLTMAAGMR